MSAAARRPSVVLVLLVASVALSAAAFVRWLGGEGEESFATAGDVSAVGYGALPGWLEMTDVVTVRNRGEIDRKIGPGTVVFALEPELERHAIRTRFRKTVRRCRDLGAEVVVVLPKWESRRDPDHPAWVAEVRPVDPETVESLLGRLFPAPEADEIAAFLRDPIGAEGAPEPAGPADPAGRSPTASRLQRVAGPAVGPIHLGDARGAVIARVTGGVWVIADPDLLNNAGLGRGRNAEIVHAFVTRTLGARNVIIDETAHVVPRPTSLLRELFEFPLVVVTLHCLLLLGLAGWTGSRRSGRPRPMSPRIARGKETLVLNTAALLAAYGPPGPALARYFETAGEAAARSLRLPRGLASRERWAKLDEISQRRGTAARPSELARRIDAVQGGRARGRERPIEVARDIHGWWKEIARIGRGGNRWS